MCDPGRDYRDPPVKPADNAGRRRPPHTRHPAGAQAAPRGEFRELAVLPGPGRDCAPAAQARSLPRHRAAPSAVELSHPGTERDDGFRCRYFIRLGGKSRSIGLDGGAGQRRHQLGYRSILLALSCRHYFAFFLNNHLQCSFLTAGCGKNSYQFVSSNICYLSFGCFSVLPGTLSSPQVTTGCSTAKFTSPLICAIQPQNTSVRFMGSGYGQLSSGYGQLRSPHGTP